MDYQRPGSRLMVTTQKALNRKNNDDFAKSLFFLVNCRQVMYLMSRFFLITAQTREFPTILVMISTDVTTVPAISADSDMTKRCQCCKHNLKGKMTCVFHKKRQL